MPGRQEDVSNCDRPLFLKVEGLGEVESLFLLGLVAFRGGDAAVLGDVVSFLGEEMLRLKGKWFFLVFL